MEFCIFKDTFEDERSAYVAVSAGFAERLTSCESTMKVLWHEGRLGDPLYHAPAAQAGRLCQKTCSQGSQMLVCVHRDDILNFPQNFYKALTAEDGTMVYRESVSPENAKDFMQGYLRAKRGQ